MEYLLMTLFLLFVIIILIFFLIWWQSTQWSSDKQSLRIARVDTLMNRFINSPIFVKENSVFDDTRLMAAQSLGPGFCEDLERLFGEDWFIEVIALSTRPGCAGPCDASSYPCCGSWEICGQSGNNITRVIPVNVYRKAEDRNDLAILRVGVYEYD
jgi:hypothetical protein